MDAQIATPAAEPMPILSDRRQRFAEEYLLDLNAKQAAIRAGYSKKTAQSSGPRLLTFVEVKRYIALRQAQIAEAVQLTPETIARELARIGFAKMSDYIKIVEGKPVVDMAKCTPQQINAIAKLSADGSIHLQKLAALDQLSKLLGFYTETVEVSGRNGGPLEVDANISGLTTVEITQRLASIIEHERASQADADNIGG